MKYTEEDFKVDYMFVSNKQEGRQKEIKRTPLGKVCDKRMEIGEYENEILNLNTVLKVDHHMRTPYSIHMSYPSARSLYTINLYVLFHGYAVKKGFFGENVVYQIENTGLSTMELCEGDILIEADTFKDPHYPCIYKTLQNLEIGHLLYNIAFVAGIYGCQYIADNHLDQFLILRKTERTAHFLEKRKNYLNEFWRKAYLRSSGKYYGGLINFETDHRQYRYYPEKAQTMKEIVFQNEPEKYIKTILLLNDGSKYVAEKYHIECSYQKLMKEYRYVNFRTQTQVYLIMLKRAVEGIADYAEVIQYMGMLAQEICLENAGEGVFNRPVKQVMQMFWKEILRQNADFDDDIPFYGVITGRDSTERVSYKIVV